MMNRKMKQLALAVGVALGSVGLLPSAQAVNVSPDNLGQALIFPYYTVRGGWNTLIGVTNTTNQWVAVKVRFREAYNSRDVFDFNIILSPHDLWAATVTNGAGNNPQLNIPADETTCTVGLGSNPQPFPAPVSYVGRFSDGGPEDVERLRSGYVEMIMMGATEDEGEDALPSDYDTCAELSSLFRATSVTPAAALDELRNTIFTVYPANALKGTFSLVNAVEGFNAVSLPTALANFRTDPYVTLHRAPNNSPAPNTIVFADSWHEPSLNAATTPGVYIDAAGALFTGEASGGAAAVTSALEATALVNEWTRNPNAGGGSFITATDWVVTFPTKNFYVDTATHEYAGRATDFVGRVDPALPPGPDADPADFTPFANEFDDGESCDTVVPTVYNRSEDSAEIEVPSPSGRFELCRETNVLTFNDGLILGNVEDDAVPIDFPGTFLYGWMNLAFEGSLPAIGFAVSSRDLTNGGSNLLSEAAAYDHSIVRPVAAP
jgi:hypothetical protein